MNRYQILALFLLFSSLLFFITRFVAGIIYTSRMTTNVILQFTDAVDVAARVFGVYLIVLFQTAVVGLLISRAKHKPEHVKGFKFSLMSCEILIMAYLAVYLIEL